MLADRIIEAGHPTRSFPFGRDVDTLIVCRDEIQRSSAVLGLRIKAQYEVWTAPLTGSRFNRIICICGTPEGAASAAYFEDFLKEYLPTKLAPGGELFIL